MTFLVNSLWALRQTFVAVEAHGTTGVGRYYSIDLISYFARAVVAPKSIEAIMNTFVTLEVGPLSAFVYVHAIDTVASKATFASALKRSVSVYAVGVLVAVVRTKDAFIDVVAEQYSVSSVTDFARARKISERIRARCPNVTVFCAKQTFVNIVAVADAVTSVTDIAFASKAI